MNSTNLTRKDVIKMIAIPSAVFAIIALVVVFISHMVVEHAQNTKELYDTIQRDDIQSVKKILDEHPHLVNTERYIVVPIDAANTLPIHEAVKYCDIDMVALLIESGADVNKYSYGYALIDALRFGKYDIAWYLIENGASINVRCDEYSGTVPFAIISKVAKSDEMAQEQLELFDYVVQNGASIESPPGFKNCILYEAVTSNTLVMEYLLDNDLVDVNETFPSRYCKTALIVAVEASDYQSCKILLEHGAHIDLKDAHGKTALDYATENCDERIISLLMN